MELTHEELHRLVKAESSSVEWKESARDTSELLHAVSALANDLENKGTPGTIVIGIRKDGQPVGLRHTEEERDREIQSITNKIFSTKLLPHPSCTVDCAESKGSTIYLVRVEPYPVPPIVCVDRVPWVRVGTTTRRANEADILRLQERRPQHNQPFDIRPVGHASVDDLNLLLLRQMYEPDKDGDSDEESFPGLEQWLAQRDLLRKIQNQWTPNAAAILLYGLSPQTFLPGAIVDFVRYDGDDFDAQIRLRKTASGTLSDQLEAVWTLVTNLVTEIPAGSNGIRTPFVHDYPPEALKELVRNLVQHRQYESTHAPGRISWFDDRIVFNNPGAPFGQASQGEFGEHADYRNPTTTRELAALGYVERLGRGIKRVRSLLKRNGNPPLEVETDGYTTITVRRRP